MTEDEAHRLGAEAARKANEAAAPLLRAALEQARTVPGTEAHAVATARAQEAARSLLDAAAYVTPERAVFALARMSAALIDELAGTHGLDAASLLDRFEQDLFLWNLNTDPSTQ
ncbi:hypothetical protein ACI2K6_10425 [Microbacterium sp. NPDC006705]|uniref:hypothetical protein n=1 Tax=Microbacterium sp. NPDC006705 TaxID=3364181 RepID=UPI00384B40BC